ncbi:MAG: thiamine pyrophosphate-dependent enzyme [Parachlamydiales bacterium]|jgi:2-oxoisovalerate dehydrogenase E1 component
MIQPTSLEPAALPAACQNQPAVKALFSNSLDEKSYALAVFRTMLLTRLADEKMSRQVKQNKGSSFFLSSSGHEIIGAVAALEMQEGLDWALPYYRDRALALGLGCPLKELIAAFLAKELPRHSGGRMMLDHFSDFQRRIPAQSSCVGSQFLQAVGVAKGIKLKKAREAVYVSSGDGATSQGDFHEALNFACLHHLPVVFVIQDNGWAISTPSAEQTEGSLAGRSSGYAGLRVLTAEGADFLKTKAVFQEAFYLAREKSRPSLVIIKVPRLGPHTISDDDSKYRDAKTKALEQKQDPLLHLEQFLLDRGYLTLEGLLELKAGLKAEVEKAALEAEAYPFPEKDRAQGPVFKDFELEKIPADAEKITEEAPRIVLVDALNQALKEEMQRDPRVLVFGEDVAKGKGGVFGVTRSLTDLFGLERCFNTPLAESTIIGVAMGLAFNGFRPVVEIQFADYIWTGINQLVNELASLHYRSNGEWHCPVVVRMPYGGYIQGGPYHSQSLEAVFCHLPGLKVAVPSNALDAKRLLKTAIRDPNPVVFLEHKALYRQRTFASGRQSGENELLPFGRAKVVLEGRHLTVVAWGMMVSMAHEIAGKLKREEGLEVELIDLRTLVPFDLKTVLASVQKTGRLLILQEAFRTCGFASEVAARVMEEGFQYLDAPIQRVAGADCPIPYNKELENAVLPQKEDIEKAIRRLLDF